MDEAVHMEAVTARGWLSVQPEPFQKAALARARLVTFSAGDAAYQVEDEPGGIFGVVSGSFHLSLATPDGSDRLAHIIRPGVWFGEGPVLVGGRRFLSVTAAELSTALHLPLVAVAELRTKDVQIDRAFASLAEFNVRISITAVGDLLIPKSDRRIAAVLLRITDALQGAVPADPAGFVLTQARLAQMANVSRHLVNQTLGWFESQGWVRVSYNRIAIVDAGRLSTFVATGE